MSSPAEFGITHANPPMRGVVVCRRKSAPRASYDAADDNHGNKRHWANADGLSAKAANSAEVRRKLRNRARLEFDNGGNCRGAIETYAHDLVGTGPRLQLTLPEGVHPDAAKTIERLFRDWCDDKTVNFADKLRVMVESEVRDGESFALFRRNEKVGGACKIDFAVIEAEQVATPDLNPLDKKAVDGIQFDENGNPRSYHVLKEHPGDLSLVSFGGYSTVPASEVIHWFRPCRAGQARGIPRITPGLPLIAMVRGYASATLTAARTAAQVSAVIETNASPEAVAEVAPYDPVEWEDGMGLTMPAGWKMNQLRPEQPTSTHKEFKETCLTEFGRSIHQPRNVVTGDSSGYNFSSARLDHLINRGAIRIERNRFSITVVDRIFVKWAEWAIVTRGYIPLEILATLPDISTWTWAWQYDGFPSINPVDDANADEINLKNGLTHHGELLNQRGVDWREHFDAVAEQYAYAKAKGIDHLMYPWLAKSQPAPAESTTRTNEGTRGQPQDGRSLHGSEWQAEMDTVLDEEAAHA